jgi:hypothetical protein
MTNFIFELSLEGKDLSPTTVSIHELANFLESIETVVVKTLSHTVQGIDEDQAVVSLVEIGAGSAHYSFAAAPPVTPELIRLIGNSIRTQNYKRLPNAAISGLRDLQRFSEQRQAVIKWNLLENRHKSLIAEIRPDVGLNLPTLDTVKGTTVVYGKLTRVGGTPPKARVSLLSGEAISCLVSEQLAKRIGNRLYEVIGLEGDAEWDITDYSLLSFRANAITSFEEGTAREALKALGEVSGEGWNHGNDTNAFVEELRRG